MIDSKPNSNNRSYLLSAGCKNTGDVPPKMKSAPLPVRVNGKITAPQIDLRDETGASLGVQALPAALALAQSQSLDVVEIHPNATPPVCLLIDYGVFRFRTQDGKLPKQWNR